MSGLFKSKPSTPSKPQPVPSVPGKYIDPPWLKWARGELGQHEVSGGENPRIIWYFSHCDEKYREDEIPWCAAFVNTSLIENGVKGTRSEAAMSFAQSALFEKLVSPIHGCIVVWAWSNGGHHVNIHDGNSSFDFGCLGGNQSDPNSGGRVSLGEYGAYVPKRVVGYYWPKGYSKKV
jgi:uncharacterized protein (TIGR02594 family)